MTSYDRWLESPYTDAEDCDDCDDCAEYCTGHEVADRDGEKDFFDDLKQQEREEDARNERDEN